MRPPLRWIIASVAGLLMGIGGLWDSASAADRTERPGLPLQTILELEQTARLLAILLDSGRAVVNDNQAVFDEATPTTQGPFSPESFERQLTDMFRSRAGADLQELEHAGMPEPAKRLLRELVGVSRQVVARARSDGPRRTIDGQPFIPAIFGAQVATRFMARTGVRLKQTALHPRNPANAPDDFERSALEAFSEPTYPHEKIISEVTAKGRTIRLMFPLYMTRHCLACHGEPKGSLDQTGHPREGFQLGQNAGAISVMLPLNQ